MDPNEEEEEESQEKDERVDPMHLQWESLSRKVSVGKSPSEILSFLEG